MRMRGRGAVLVVLAVAAGALVAIAPIGAGAAPKRHVTLRMVLPSRRMVAGSTMDATVIVQNPTGAPLHLVGCGPPFGIVLGPGDAPPPTAHTLCRQDIVIPKGTTRYPVTVSSSLTMCGDGPSSTPCLPGGKVPTLAPGKYHAFLVQYPTVAPAPRPIPVKVTAATP